MANITQINPNTITNPQSFNTEDTILMTSVITSSLFDIANDNVEYFIYDLNNNLLSQQIPFNNWNVTFDPSLANSSGSISTINLSPEKDLANSGYSFGKLKSVYNFVSNKLGTSPNNQLFISEISSDRTEIRLKSNFISNDSLKIQYEDFKAQLENDQYFDEFYLNFGNNNYVLSVNILLDETTSNYSLLIKLYEPLPSQYTTKSECYVVIKTAESVAYEVQFDDIITGFNSIQIKPANFNIDELDLINPSSIYKDYSSITSTTSSGSLYQILNNLSGSTFDVPIDYSDYNNFVFFSSAAQRLSNFRSKIISISSSQAQLNAINASILGPTLSNNVVISSKEVLEKQIKDIITNFDNYENYLYYQSSSYAWPKTNTTPPYVLYDITSSVATNWYSNQLSTASNFDSNNQNYLYYSVPQYLRESSDNDNYLLFVDMVSQLFDQIWLYTKTITDKTNSSPGLDLGVSKDLVADVLESLGVKLYGSNFTAENIYNSLIGLNPDGGLLLPTGSELITDYVVSSTSASLVPTIDDYHKLTYKKIYHALPYLLKKKGTPVGLKALLNIFGIPDTILRINEFGGKDKNSNTYDFWQNEYDYAYKATGSYYISSSFSLNSTWGASDNVPGAVEFRFKAESVPPTNASQSLWYTDKGLGIFLEYTGSGLSTGSYSGSVVDSYNQYGTLKFISGTDSASVYLPFFNDGWWSVLINSSSAGYTLYAKNNTYSGNDGNTLGFQASSTLNVPTLWSGSTVSYFVSSSGNYKNLSGSLQEIRYYTQPLTEDGFDAYVMNPNSIEQSQHLAFRAALGGELYTGSTSIHPKVSGTWTTTSSFTGTSNFYISANPTYLPNDEISFYNQPAVGIQNAVSSKIQNKEIILPPSNTKPNIPVNTVLSPFRSIQQTPSISSSYTSDVNYVEVAFSPQNEINEDIMSTLGYFNIGDYIGDPRQVSSSNQSYPDLDALRNLYFEKYSSNYDWTDYLRLIKYFDNSLFKMLKDYVPAKASLASGVVVKQHLLERNKYPVPQVDFTQAEYTASINMYQITGSDGGALNITPIVTQSWTGVNDTVLGPVSFVHNTEDEFFNGIFSGSQLTVTDGELGYPISLTTLGSWQVGSNINVSNTTLRAIGFDFDLDQTYYIQFTYTIQAPGGTSISLKDGLGKTYFTTDSTAVTDATTDLIEIKNPFQPLGFLKSNATSICAVRDVYIYKYVIDAYDADPLLNNVLVNRPNPYYIDVDYSNSQNTPVNLSTILSGSGTRFAIPESNYTSFRSINPRYLGSKNSGQYNYSQFYASSSITPGYPIDYFSNYFIYFDWIGGSNPQYPGGGNLHGIYLIGVDGIAVPLTTDNKNLQIVSNIFVKGTTANILPAVYSSGNPSSKVDIIEGGALYQTILFKSGSDVPRYAVKWENDPVRYIKTPTFFTSSTPYSTLIDNNQYWLYPFLTSSDASLGSIEYIQPRRVTTQTLFFYNKKKGDFALTTDNDEGKTLLSDTYFPIQYGDFIRFGTTGSIITDSGSLDGSFEGFDLVNIKNIIIPVTSSETSSLLITPSLVSSSILMGDNNNQSFRIMRRIPNESFILIKNIPAYTDPGFLIPQNFNPNYDPYTLARKAGLIS